MKRYAIVRVGKGGSCVEEFVCSGNCKKCNYGDTKEQLIRKVVQIVSKQLRLVSEEDFFKFAKELVEFLGVE